MLTSHRELIAGLDEINQTVLVQGDWEDDGIPPFKSA
jgi:hypothetical protein